VCGRSVPPGGRSEERECVAFGLGDAVASGLSAVGITKDRVQKVASIFGVSDCGCEKRQEALNRFSRRILSPQAREDGSETA